ncbi:MAG: 4-hydroxythreonine-4-phosphate dehydrogenase PdxA [Granulosicoccaceae bacterium]
MTPNSPPVLAITSGEPAGIGPELCARLSPVEGLRLVILADPNLLQQRNPGPNLPLYQRGGNEPISVYPVPLRAESVAGELNQSNAAYVLELLDIGARGCLDGEFAAVVTAPVHKGVINDAGIAFSGHTEYFAEICAATPVMLLVADKLRVALATTHLPLADVAQALSHEVLASRLQILHKDLQQKYGIPAPRILVAGLNPHAGEGGHLGREELDMIEPCLDSLREQGLDLIGPLPADTLFTPPHLSSADAVMAMYHDQGLPVLKFAGFGRAVNVTLGLPIVRTSVDHGTALDLAGTGKAKIGSLQAAIEEAARIVAA